MKADMHVHTRYSADAVSSPEKVIKSAIKKGIDCLAITDHNTTAGWDGSIRISKRLDFPLILGEEVLAIRNGKKLGEILGYFLTEEISPGEPMDIIDSIKSQGGLSSIAHPFDSMRNPFLDPETIKKADALEVFNSRVTFRKNNTKALELARRLGKAITAGSDAHFSREIGNAYINADCRDAEELRKAILNKKVEFFGRRSNPLVHAVSFVAKRCIRP
jgi:predicted metal-dependent phosphoesterase TrpH